MKPIMNLDEVKFDDIEENGLYTSKRGQISDHIGAKKLGYNLTVLPPGKVQCPFHCHHGEEEMFLIIDGEGELRFGDKRYPIRRHDVIACPPGGWDVAHQIINTGKTTMRYLALSTLVDVDTTTTTAKRYEQSCSRSKPKSKVVMRYLGAEKKTPHGLIRSASVTESRRSNSTGAISFTLRRSKSTSVSIR